MVRRVTLESAVDAVTIIGLPLCLADGSVRARVVSPPAVVAVATGVALHVRAPEDVCAPPEAALREATRARVAVEQAIEAVSQQRALLAQIPVLPRAPNIEGRAPQPSPFAARVAQARFIADRVAAWDAELEDLRDQQRDAVERVEAARADLAAYSTALSTRAAPVTKSVSVHVRGDVEGPIDLEIEYRVPGARWAPQYQVRLDADGAGAEIVLRAAIAQSTGEDWRGVQLELSTAQALRPTTRPTLNALRIGEVQPSPPAPPTRPPPRGADALFAAFDQARARAPELAAPTPGASLPTPRQPRVHELWAPPIRGIGGDEAHIGSAGFDDMAAEESSVMFGGAAPAAEAVVTGPPPAPAAPSAARRRARPAPAPRSKKSASAERRVERGADVVAGPPADYADLALAGPMDAARGRLTRADDMQRYQQALAASGRHVDVDVSRLLAAAVRQTQRVGALPAGASDVRRAVGHHDYIYVADARVDVRGDAAWHTVPLGVRRASCETRYVAVPRLDPNVYRIARLQNPLAAPLLPGEAEVYVDGEYVLSAPVPFVAGDAVVELGLGVEQRLRCARNTRFAEERGAESVVGMTDLVHRIEIAVRNGLRRDADVEVRERIPQPAKDAEVVVEERAVAPAWAPYSQREHGSKIHGGRRWRLTVAAGEEAQLSAEYAVRIYSKNALVGGNRREA